MKIYTKTGDRGKTSLMNGQRVLKSNIRVETYGTVDEVNSAIGVVLAEISNSKYPISNIKKELKNIQEDLFELGSMLANPDSRFKNQDSRYFDKRVSQFEHLIDKMTEQVPLLTNFILPGGGKAGALLHVARTISRRAERRVIELSQKEKVEGFGIRYFNRLSDLLFTMSRFVNMKQKKKEIIWKSRR